VLRCEDFRHIVEEWCCRVLLMLAGWLMAARPPTHCGVNIQILLVIVTVNKPPKFIAVLIG
jgi:hypothetical protein